MENPRQRQDRLACLRAFACLARTRQPASPPVHLRNRHVTCSHGRKCPAANPDPTDAYHVARRNCARYPTPLPTKVARLPTYR